MKTRSLGPGAPDVSCVGLGGMPLSTQNRPSEEQAIRTIHAALDAGVTLIDTADVYCIDHRDIGHNERLIAKALKQWQGDRDSVLVATKGGMERPDGHWERNGSPAHLEEACNRSLKALKVEQIDLYQLHTPDPQVDFMDSIFQLKDLQREGKIRHLGLSNVSVEQIRMARRVADIVTVQNRLNPFFREAIERGVVEHCSDEGLGFLAYSPVGGGRLNKKLPDMPLLKELAAKYNASEHSIVQAWVLAQGSSVIVIPGARTPEHAVDSTKSAEIELSSQDLERISAAEFSRE